MPRFVVAALTLTLTLVLAAVACGGGSASSPTPSASPTPRPSPGVTFQPQTATPLTNTPQPTASPTGTASPSPTNQPTNTLRPTATPAPEVKRAVAPSNLGAFLAQFQGQPVNERPCAYDPRQSLAVCGSPGNYSLEPAPTGQDISCLLLSLNGEPKGLSCTAKEPAQAFYYAIQ